jgi:hypothetical protein
MMVGPALALIVLPLAGFFIIRYADWTKLYNARLLPYWYYAVFLFAGLFVGLALMELVRRLRPQPGAVWGTAVPAAVIFLVIAAVGIQKTPSWAQWNYTGYEGKAPYPEYRAVLELVDTLPPGRIMWEANHDMNKYGTPMALMLFPYWSEGHPSMEGLLFESSLTTRFHFLNAAEASLRPSNPVGGLRYHAMDFSRAVPHLALYDVAYYVSYTEEAAAEASDYGLELLGETAPFQVFALPETELVDVAAYQPSVWAGEGAFLEASLDWYDDLTLLDRWMVREGPDGWPRVETVDAVAAAEPLSAGGVVSDIVLEPHRISFHTTAVGVPHLVKVSYFPNWRAINAEGPYLATPSLMLVVPTGEDVVLEFDNTWVEIGGMVLTGGALLGLAGLGVARLVRRRRAA